jgi:hypothetical protein
MTTVVIQVGNSDDKLTQKEWADFVDEMNGIVTGTLTMHFHGFCPGNMPWQNACWIGTGEEVAVKRMLDRIKDCRSRFKQDSVAVTLGGTVFI